MVSVCHVRHKDSNDQNKKNHKNLNTQKLLDLQYISVSTVIGSITNVGLMSGHHRRRWFNIISALVLIIVFAETCCPLRHGQRLTISPHCWQGYEEGDNGVTLHSTRLQWKYKTNWQLTWINIRLQFVCLCRAKRQHLATLQVKIYCILALHSSSRLYKHDKHTV